MGCGDIKFLQGGVIDGSTVINSQITNCAISASTITASAMSKSDISESKIEQSDVLNSKVADSELVNCEVQKLAGIDAQSAKTIADAISILPKAELVALASAIFDALQVPVAQEPEFTNDSTISTNVFGDAEGVLGKPDHWGSFGGFAVPLYRPGE